MPMTAAIGGLSLTTSLQTLVTNPAGDAKVRTYVLDFVNIDGTATASVTQCLWIDVSAGAERPLMSINTDVRPGRDGALSRRIVLDPGDSVKVAASAAADIYVTVTQVFEEPAS